MKSPLLLLLALASLGLGAVSHAGSPVQPKDLHDPAPAPEGVGPFVSLFGGANVYQTADLLHPGFSSRDLESETGWLVGGKAGYVFQTGTPLQPGLEAEISYLHNDFHAEGTVNERTNRRFIHDRQDVHILPVMVNGYLKYELGRFRPYLGGGIGVAYARRDEEARTEDIRFRDGLQVREQRLIRSHFGHTDEFSFAAQGIAGLEYLCTSQLSVYVEYKALWLKDADDIENYINHLVTGGVRLYF